MRVQPGTDDFIQKAVRHHRESHLPPAVARVRRDEHAHVAV